MDPPGSHLPHPSPQGQARKGLRGRAEGTAVPGTETPCPPTSCVRAAAFPSFRSSASSSATLSQLTVWGLMSQMCTVPCAGPRRLPLGRGCAILASHTRWVESRSLRLNLPSFLTSAPPRPLPPSSSSLGRVCWVLPCSRKSDRLSWWCQTPPLPVRVAGGDSDKNGGFLGLPVLPILGLPQWQTMQEKTEGVTWGSGCINAWGERPAGCAGLTKVACFPSAPPPTRTQVLELESPSLPPASDVTTPEPGIYHGICEYPLWGQCPGAGGPSGARGRRGPVGAGIPLDSWAGCTLYRDAKPREEWGLTQP